MNIADLAIKIVATDCVSATFGRVSKALRETNREVRELWAAGRKTDAVLKGAARIGAWGGSAFGSLSAGLGVSGIVSGLADAQEGFAKIQVKAGKTAKEMEAFRSEVYKIAAETGSAPERILDAALSKVGKGVADGDVFASVRTAALYAKASFSKDVGAFMSGASALGRQMNLTGEEARMTMAGIFEVAAGAGKLGMEDMLAATEGMMRGAKEMGLTGAKGAVQIAAAAKFASRDMSGAEAVSGVEALFADMLAAKTEGTLAKANINLDELTKRAVKSGDAVGTIVKEIMDKTKGDEVALSRLFKSGATRDLIRSIHAAGPEFEKTWRGALATAASGDHGAAEDAAKKAGATMAGQMDLFRAQLTKGLDNEVAPWLGRLTKAFEWLNSDAKGAAAAMLALKAAAAAAAKAVDEADQKTQETRKVLFKRVDDMQKEINTLQTELAKTTGLLEGHLKAMHEDAHIDRTVKQLEDRIEKRLEGISAQMEGQTQLLHQLLAARAPLGNS